MSKTVIVHHPRLSSLKGLVGGRVNERPWIDTKGYLAFESHPMESSYFPIQGGLSPAAEERSAKPRNYGPLDVFHAHAKITGTCGDTMEFWLQITAQHIKDAGFTTTGCGSSRAAGSMATELAIGKGLREAAAIEPVDILAALGGLPKKSEHCALLAATTLKAAIEDFTSRKVGGRRESKPREPSGQSSGTWRLDECHDSSPTAHLPQQQSQTKAQKTPRQNGKDHHDSGR